MDTLLNDDNSNIPLVDAASFYLTKNAVDLEDLPFYEFSRLVLVFYRSLSLEKLSLSYDNFVVVRKVIRRDFKVQRCGSFSCSSRDIVM